MNRNISRAVMVIWTAVVFTLTGFPSLESPKIKEFPMDKIYHFLIFFVLGMLAVRNFKFKGFVIFCLLAVMLAELQQVVIPGRDFELLDIAAGLMGIAAAYLTFTIWSRRRRGHGLSKA